MMFCLGFALVLAAGVRWATAADVPKQAWTDPQDSSLPVEFKFQGHGNPLQFRNTWVVERE